MTSRPLTPFFSPRSFNASSFGISSTSVQTTSDPMRSNGTSRSSQTLPIISFPATLYFAMSVPGSAS